MTRFVTMLTTVAVLMAAVAPAAYTYASIV